MSKTFHAGYSVIGPLPVLNSNGSTYPEQVLHEASVCGVIGGRSN